MARRRSRRRWAVAAVIAAAVPVAGWWLLPPAPEATAPAETGRWPTPGALSAGSGFLETVPEPPPRAGEPGVELASTPDPFAAPRSLMAVSRPPGRAEAAGASDAADAADRWVVTAVLIGEGVRRAVVNDRLVGPGDRLPDGARVVEIEPGRVAIVPPGASDGIDVSAGGEGGGGGGEGSRDGADGRDDGRRWLRIEEGSGR